MRHTLLTLKKRPIFENYANATTIAQQKPVQKLL